MEEVPPTWTQLFRPVLERAWLVARAHIMNAAWLEADQHVWELYSDAHMGDPARRVDLMMHQYLEGELKRVLPELQVLGEENLPAQFVLDPEQFRYLAYIDPVDGSRQAFSLPGCWSINLVVQQYLGRSAADGAPEFEHRLLAIVDAEGVCVSSEAGSPAVEAKPSDDLPRLYSDQHVLIEEGQARGITGVTTVLVGGYKSDWWSAFRDLREAVPAYPVFNTAGAPVAHKVIKNSDLVVVQSTESTLWDGIHAGLIAAAGGFVIPKGEAEPIPNANVLAWFSQFGYQFRGTQGGLTERYVIPAFTAGMDFSRVSEVAAIASKV